MSPRNITSSFLKLQSHFKLMGIGSIVLLASTILPWYSDIDAYKIGDLFLGVTGPASFVGIIILLLSFISFGIFLTHLLERRKLKLPVRESVFQLFVGVESLFLLLLVNSIYFHPKFGVNILLKETRFGMILAILGAILVTIGGYFQYKHDANTEDLIGKLEPLVEVRAHTPLERKPEPKTEKPVTRVQEPLLREESEASPPSQSSPPSPPSPSSPQRPSGSGTWMWRGK